MSCCCSYECQCTKVASTTTSTTTTTLCPDAIPCDSVVLTDCVVYSGCDDDCFQIFTGDTLTQVFANIFEAYEECYGPIETTTTGAPEQLVEVCFSYAEIGGCAAACGQECSTYYMYESCANNISLDCIVYEDSAGTIPAPNGWYSKPGGGCYILGFGNGEITGLTPCP